MEEVRRGRARPLAGIALFAVAASILLLAPGAAVARVSLGRSVYRLFAHGSNGYDLRVSTYENRHNHRISLTAENGEGQYVRYSVEGAPEAGRLRAVFPGVGRIDVEMRSGKFRALPPPKGCRLPKTVVEYGTFVGRVRLRGERGYTALDVDRIHGAIERGKRQECERQRSIGGSGGSASRRGGGIRDFTTLNLVSGNVTVYATEPAARTEAGFQATAHEMRGGMEIERHTPSVSAAGDLEANAELTLAQISPPAPFLGTAIFTSPPPSTGCPLPCPPPLGQMSGSLRVPLPGLGVIPLTGPGVEAHLERDVRAY